MTNLRIGQGYDVHRLEKGRKLILGGVEIPFELGLLGHSDADVLTHAVMDALLGAAALRDIGKLFPDNDPKLLGIDSMLLLSKVCRLIREKGYEIVNIDCILVAQKPKISPYIEKMRENYAKVMEIDINRVSVKATTEEGLGFTGVSNGMSAHGICLLEKTE